MSNASRNLNALLDPSPRTFFPVVPDTTMDSTGRIERHQPVAITDDERCYFDSHSARDFRAMMTGNRAPFLS